MPREEHIMRQTEWKRHLERYGKVELEKQLLIKGARVVIDVYAVIENKEFIIEIGNIDDRRKYALLQFYVESKPNVVFIHEPYGKNRIQETVEKITAYQNSPEYQEYLTEQLKKLKKDMQRSQQTVLIWLSFTGIFGIALLTIPTFYYTIRDVVSSTTSNDVTGLGTFCLIFCLVVWFYPIIVLGKSISKKGFQIKEIEQKIQNKTPVLMDKKRRQKRGNEESYEKAIDEEGTEKEPEHDITYGEDTWEQEDDEWTEELNSMNEMEW